MATNARGFTVIEMAISLVVLGILVALAIPEFRSWMNDSQVRTATEAIKNGLQYARAEAVRRNLPVRWQLATSNDGAWTVTVRDTAEQIQTRGATEGSRSVSVAATQSTVDFIGNGWVNPTPVAAIVINVSNPAGGTCQAAGGDVRCLRITVSSAGQIRMCDPKMDITSVASC